MILEILATSEKSLKVKKSIKTDSTIKASCSSKPCLTMKCLTFKLSAFIALIVSDFSVMLGLKIVSLICAKTRLLIPLPT